MPAYRLKPRLPVWKLAGAAIMLLVAPAVASLVIPQLHDAHSQVTLGQPGMDWEVPITWPDGSQLRCQEAGDVMFPVWDCEGTMVHTFIMEDSRDPENTLERALRAALLTDITPGTFHRHGEVLIYDADEAIGLATQRDNETMIAIVTGEQQRDYAEVIMYELDGRRGPKPEVGDLEDAA